MKYQSLFVTLFFSSLFYGDVDGRPHILENKLPCSGLNSFPNGSFTNIEILDCYGNNFKSLEAYVFSNRHLYNLRIVSIQASNITKIQPNAFANMSNIVQLDLSQNRLTTFHNDSFAGLVALTVLNLESNKIETIDRAVLKPLHSLNKLYLNNNKIRRLDPNFLVASSVTQLILDQNPLIFEENEALLVSDTLTDLSLQSCNIHKLPSNSFGRLPQLKSLDLASNQLSRFPKCFLKTHRTLQELDISFNRFFHVPTCLPPNVQLNCEGNFLADGVECDEVLSMIRHHPNSEEVASNSSTMGEIAGGVVSQALKHHAGNYGNSNKDGGLGYRYVVPIIFVVRIVLIV